MKLELEALAEAVVVTLPVAEPDAVPELSVVAVRSLVMLAENSAESSETMLFSELMPWTLTVFVVGAVCVNDEFCVTTVSSLKVLLFVISTA